MLGYPVSFSETARQLAVAAIIVKSCAANIPRTLYTMPHVLMEIKIEFVAGV
jgi:hypothetical protein